MLRKVLHAVPIQETWSMAQITSEMGRTGTPPDKKTMSWSLQTLREHKLIREPQTGLWIRVASRPKLATVPTEEEEREEMPAPKPVQVAANTPMSAIDKLGNVSSTLRKMSAQLAALAEDIDEAAIEMESKAQSSSAEHEKLKQLAAVLKSLTQ